MPVFASSFTKELRTNHVPSLRDRGYIQSLLIEPRKRLSEMNSKISELERSLNELKRERDILEEEIEQHALLLTPFRRLPDDMLREIFIACLPDDRNAIMSYRKAPLLLGLVCRKWRALAYSTPALWASLHIPYPVRAIVPHGIPGINQHHIQVHVKTDRLEKHYTAVKDWLIRSGACPLSISFSCMHLESAGQDDDVLNEAVHTYVSILLGFSHRWRSLELFIPPGRHLNRIGDLPETSVPNLKHLRLIFSRSMGDSLSSQWRSSPLLKTPTLKSLHISCIPFRLSSVPNNWDHLTSLTLTNGNSTVFSQPSIRNMASIEEAYAIFNMCWRLVHCALDIIDGPTAVSLSGVISLPNLKSLSIVDSCNRLSTLFECFANMSSIRGISYYSKLRPSNNRKSPLVALLARTDQRIEFLQLDSSHFTLADIITIFDLAPNVINFIETYTSREISQDFFHTLRPRNILLPDSFSFHKAFLDLLVKPRSNGGMYFPRLESLHLEKLCKLADKDIISFLQRRMEESSGNGSIVPLQRMSISLLLNPEEVDIAAQLSAYPSLKVKIGRPTQPPRPSSKPTIIPEIGCIVRPIPAMILALD
ncbi:hypothetical protein BDN70DRAFT_828262 [Pholiota conissans]|uniref:F-box domain-containing protein n=1 Tax=Pholiota conissans TaxID=109636 RepID=A0A9P5Z7L6_9AGAR|nr:hypothetical protein BDN70DRAFT_828262 [Pholiota conissans]